MYSKFLGGVTDKLAEQWSTNLLTPAFIFWLGGLAASIQAFGWDSLKDLVLKQPQSFQVAILILGLIIIITSATIAQKLDRTMLRCLEGYWPRWSTSLRQARIQRYIKQWKKRLKRWGELYGKGEDNLTSEELNEYAQLDWLIMHSPSKENLFMPTRLGNLLRASEYRSKERYGLDAVVCWPRLWLLIPDSTRKELQEANNTLSVAVRICFWSVMFLVWTPLAWWAPLLAFPAAWLSYRMVLNTAAVYVDLLESTFDIHRHLLYHAIRHKLPDHPEKEIQQGEKLTKYLWRGQYQKSDFYYNPPQK